MVAVIALRNTHAQIYIPNENVVYEGTFDQSDIAVPGLEIPITDIRSTLTGVPDLANTTPASITGLDIQEDHYVLTEVYGTDQRKLWIEPDRMIVVKETIHQQNGRAVTRNYEEYIKVNRLWRPSVVVTRSDSTAEYLELKYESQTPNGGLAPGELTLTLPRTVRRFPLAEITVN